MEREIVRLLPYFLLGIFVLGVLLFLLALQQLHVRRRGAYWRMRRRAGERGGRLFLISVGFMVTSVALTVVIGLASLAFKDVSDFLNRGPDNLYGIVLPPESALTETRGAVETVLAATQAMITLQASATPDAANVSATDAPAPSASPVVATRVVVPTVLPPEINTPAQRLFVASPTPAPVIPTNTSRTSASPTPANVIDLTPPGNVTARPAQAGYRLTLVAADDRINPNGSPIAPKQDFPAGIKRIYLFMAFENMENGVAWSRVLYRDEVALQGNALLWSLGGSGNNYFFFGDEGGYPAGAYEVRLFVGEQEASRYPFNVSSG